MPQVFDPSLTSLFSHGMGHAWSTAKIIDNIERICALARQNLVVYPNRPLLATLNALFRFHEEEGRVVGWTVVSNSLVYRLKKYGDFDRIPHLWTGDVITVPDRIGMAIAVSGEYLNGVFLS